MTLDPLNIGLIITTAITVLAGWASQRSSTKASQKTEKEKAELEAYSRARAMDLQTINRQNDEIKDLLEDNIALRKRDRDQTAEIDKLRTERLALVKQNLRQAEELREYRRGPKPDQPDV